jgi:hypothetical protein
MQALAMIGVMNSPPISSLKGRARHCSSVKHGMEALDLRVNLLTILMQQGRELIEDDPGGQGVACRCAVNLLALPLDPSNFFMKHLRPILESFLATQTLSIQLGVVPPGGSTILCFILGCS